MSVALCHLWGGTELLAVALASDTIAMREASEPWHREITNVTVEWFADRDDAVAARRVALLRHEPKYRVDYTSDLRDDGVRGLPELTQAHVTVHTISGSVVLRPAPRYLRMEDLEEESGMSRWTIMRAIKEEKLHGGQNRKNGPWRVDEAFFHAWMRGDQCEHQRAREA